MALSCSKTETPAPQGRPLTVKASIGTEDSKTTYTPEGNIMKVEWEASESISVISVDASGNVKTIDTFTYTGAPGFFNKPFSSHSKQHPARFSS